MTSRWRRAPAGGGESVRAAPARHGTADPRAPDAGRAARGGTGRHGTARGGTRIACVLAPALPLQLLVATHPDWAASPVAVVDEDRPQGRVLWADERARGAGVLPGQRYAAAQSLCRDLRAGVVPQDAVERGVTRIVTRLHGFSPGVEPAADDPGLAWLDASGLVPLYTSLESWARRLRDALAQEGFASRVVVGFTRFGTAALVRTAHGVDVIGSAHDELTAARRVSLDRLPLDPTARDLLLRLGVRDVGGFLRLPASGVRSRFGDTAHRLHRMARGDLATPLTPQAAPEPVMVEVQFGHAESDATRLLFLVKREIHDLLERTVARREALAALELTFTLDEGGSVTRVVTPAAPTLDAVQILELVHLTLEQTALPGGAVELRLAVDGRAASVEQLRLFVDNPRRDPASAQRALARLRTEFGRGAVVRARLREAHLPEARFTWDPLDAPGSRPDTGAAAREGRTRNPSRPRAAPQPEATPTVTWTPPAQVAERPLVRRIRSRPLALAPRTRHEPDGWLVRDLEHGPVMSKCGPYVVNGGWWARTVHREYAFLTTQRGDVLWAYYDRRRRRWFLQGQVE